MNDITRILSQIDSGDPAAAEQLLPLVYDELRKLASAKLAHEQPGQTLQPTILVHEAYVRLVDVKEPQQWNGRGHFFAAAGEAMRRILVESARRKQSQKRAHVIEHVEVAEIAAPRISPHSELLALDEVLTEFEQKCPDHAKLVKLRYFVGLTVPEAAEALGISIRTAERDWTYAKAWLLHALKEKE
jgi:RNA polymerase sigma factor (TIGR02999 family)